MAEFQSEFTGLENRIVYGVSSSSSQFEERRRLMSKTVKQSETVLSYSVFLFYLSFQ